MFRFYCCAAALLTACCFCLNVSAAGVPAAEWKKLAAEAVPEKYPDSPAVLLWDEQHMTYQPDGTAVTDDNFYEKILTEAGRDQKRVFSAVYHAVYEKFELLELEIFKPDGRCVPVDFLHTGKTAIEPRQMSKNIYDPSVLVYSVALPSLQIGDVVHIRMRTSEIKPRIPGEWSDIVLLQSDAPVLYYSVSVDAPAERPLGAYAVKDEVPGTMQFSKQNRGKRILYRWIARNVPPVVPEPNMPSLASCAQRLLLSTAENWGKIASWYAKLCAPRMAAVSPELSAKTAELIRNCPDDEAKVRALFQYVSQQIRYMGITPEKVAPGYEPHDVSLTFSRKYGVCRDKAALLAAMLRKAGFQAYPVLFFVGDPKDPDVPNMFFNHAIVAWEKSPGHYQLMDPTSETTREFFPAYLSNQSYLVAKAGETLRRSPIVPAEENALLLQTDAELNLMGNMTGTTVMKCSGVNDLLYRSWLLQRTPLQRLHLFSSLLKKTLPGMKLLQLKVQPENLQDMSIPLQITFQFSCSEIIERRKGEQLLALPEFCRRFGLVNYLLRDAKLEKRKFTYRPDAACLVQENWSLKFPEILSVDAIPQNVSVGSSGIWVRERKIQAEKGKIFGKNLLSLMSLEITPEQYGKLKDSLRRSASTEKALPVISAILSNEKKMTEVFKDFGSVVVKKNVSVTMEDAHTWTTQTFTHRRITGYAGVKKFSELSFSYNPVWERIHVSAYVITNGKKIDLTPGEINRMDASWVASAPRYPAERVLVCSLPNIVPGSEIFCTVKRTFRDRPFFFMKHAFLEDQPIFLKSFSFSLPEKTFYRSSPDIFGIEKKEQRANGRINVLYSSKNVGMIPPEPCQPPPAAFVPAVLVSCGSYASLASAMKAALEQKLQQPAPLTEKLARKLGPDFKKIRDYVAREIREAGPAFNALPWRYLSSPDITLASGYGNSADRAILLMRLLRAHKIPAEFVAASKMPYLVELLHLFRDYPRDAFSSLLIWLPEQMVYLNDTDEFAVPGIVAHEGKIGLSLERGRLITIAPSMRYESRVRENYRIELQESGRAKIFVEKLLFGQEYARCHSEFSRMTPERQKQYFESWASSFAQASLVPGSQKSDFSVYPGKLCCQLDVPQLAVPASVQYYSLELPGISNLSSAAAVGGSRKTPYWRSETYRRTLEYVIFLPERMTPVLQRNLQTVKKIGDSALFQENIHKEEQKIEFREHLELNPCILSPDDFEAMLKLQSFLEHPGFGRLLLHQAPPVSVRKEKK